MTDTPDTDANQIFLGLNPDEGDYFVPAEIARQLEQQRNEAVNNYETAVLREHRMQEQRDRLAEALREIAEGSPCLECGGGNAVWLAAEALASVKGGNNE